MADFSQARREMVEYQIRSRGVRDLKVLQAMATVPREQFVPQSHQGRAYTDSPLPIGWGQTISQPYIVAFMAEALSLNRDDRVLEVGAGSGYAAAVIGEIVKSVYSIERHEALAQQAATNLERAGCCNVHIRQGDGTLGWDEYAPYDAILVSAGGPSVPEALLQQLKIGGRLVIPVGADRRGQELVRITRTGTDQYDREDLADVRFVPLIGAQGWEVESGADGNSGRVVQARPKTNFRLPELIRSAGDRFEGPDDPALDRVLDAMLQRMRNARVVLIGEASHGTAEFYQLRAAITKRLIAEHGFNLVCAEADWPDAAQVHHYVTHSDADASNWTAFARFPTWMWRNEETRAFVDWLRAHNADMDAPQRTGFFGLDLYSLYTSATAVIDYLEQIDPELARVARVRYGCLSPWESDPAAYGHAAITDRYRACTNEVAQVLAALLQQRIAPADAGYHAFLDAEQNARVVASAEHYYRVMYYGSRASWNLRDSHMFDTLQRLLINRGEGSKAVVWAHNSHIGDARATEMSLRGEHNLGQLCAAAFADASYRIGFGTDHGTVAAASEWGGPMQIMQVRHAHAQSYEHQFYRTDLPAIALPLRMGRSELVDELSKQRLERAIGVIYRPETELSSHYFEADLAQQFDEYIWLSETRAIKPLTTEALKGIPDTYPFGL